MNQKKEWVFIINPIAGNGFAGKMTGILNEMILKYNISAEIVFTEKPGHATELSRQFLEKGFKYFIGVGGDGTLNEIAIPLVNNMNIVLGIIPAGTGNDFVQILGFPERFTDAHWELFFKQNLALMDVGYCNEVIFLNGMGLGFDAQVASENYISPGRTRLGSKNKYVWHILKNLLFYREKKMKVHSYMDNFETDCFINTIGNGRRFAGGFLLTPQALADDGMLDVCSIKRLSIPHRIKLLLKVPKGTHINDKKVHYYRTEKISLEFPVEVPFHVDGELHFSKKFEVGLFPKALKIIYNPEGEHFFGRQD
jgi:YegS/Rv2252/BmrU family lipid kinase